MAKKKTPKKKPKWNENTTIRGALRRAFARSPVTIEVKMAARKEFPKYNKDGSLAKKPAVRFKCAECGNWFMGKEVAVDHIKPVIREGVGFEGWETFIKRLFCEPSNLQVLCSYKLKDMDKHNNEPSCHLKKTREERNAKKLIKNKTMV